MGISEEQGSIPQFMAAQPVNSAMNRNRCQGNKLTDASDDVAGHRLL